MNITYLVELTQEEIHTLKTLLSKGMHNARLLKRANILLLANEHKHSDKNIVELLNTSTSTIYRTKKRFVEDGLDAALSEGKRTGQPKLLSANEDAKLISIACSEPPDGRARWTLALIADKLITLTELESVSLETVRQRLKHNELKPWQKKMWCIGELDSDFIAQMEEVLEIYAMPADEKHPVVNFDEAMKQLVSHVKPPKLASPGHLAKDDYEYRREDVANIFLMYDRHRGWRHAKATATKTREDFAACMRDLVDIHYPDADKIHVVLDNYITHTAGSLYKAYRAEEARRILKKIEFHYTPKHASWLNMVEIEIGVMNRQCLDRRIATWDDLLLSLTAWENGRNSEHARIKWMFDVDNARLKLNRAYKLLNSQN